MKDRRILKVSVKGSQDGGWALLAKYKKGRTWTEAVDQWLVNQPNDVVMFFVQFQGVDFDVMPNMYLAKAPEVATHLKSGRNGHVSTCLLEDYYYSRGIGKGWTDKIPDAWICTEVRIENI